MFEAVVVRKHKSNYPNPVSFVAGDALLVGERDSEYLGWVRVTDKRGDVGWAPLKYIELNGDGTGGVAIKFYSAKELDVEPGERLTVKYEHCQWCWVEHETKGAGWVPIECLENA
ncbi:SH3 domain-containing protein [Lacimicrobium alkaliphilum]|nr:SH3 domain-containing protein [Lacimicrobium alkaliphilum]